jgi:CubicO group peptidase (beta-lactamase class C family)
VLVRHVLAHTAGLPDFDGPVSAGDLYDWQYRGFDQVLGTSMRYGMGYGIFDPSVGWGGWGGSLVMVDLEARMAVAYVMNQMLDQDLGDYRGLGIVIAAHEGVS